MKGIKEKFGNLKVKVKLLVLAGVLVGGIILVGITAIFGAGFLNKSTTSLADEWMTSALLAADMNTYTSDYRILQYAFLNSTTNEAMDEFEKQIEEKAAVISEASAAYEANIYNEEDRVMLMEVREAWAAYLEKGNEVLELSRAGQRDEAAALMLGECTTLYGTFDEKINALVEYNEDGASFAANYAANTYVFVIVLILIILVIIIVFAAVISTITTKSITEPLLEVEEILDSMSKGSLELHMDYNAKDEFGDLAKAINFVVEALKTIISDESRLLMEMAEGNFNIRTEAEKLYIGSYEPILTSLRGINRKLGTAMAEIAESSSQVQVASEQLAGEAQILAEGATEQASTVEELLATVEEVTNQASEGAVQAEKSSIDADNVKKQAIRSNERMQDMIEAMNNINQTSKEISTIIQTIESIASQTNLLSLNASIEAARAGEAGRGFAVVADEIGKLALQCSEAAGNTKNLIETAMLQAETGDKIAKDTAEELFSVTEGVEKIVDASNAVKINCENQAESMKQIDQGIEVISRVVEHNSAAAEESSAASEELAAHAQNLQNQMSLFKFRD